MIKHNNKINYSIIITFLVEKNIVSTILISYYEVTTTSAYLWLCSDGDGVVDPLRIST